MHPTAMQPAAWNAVRKNSVLLPQSRLKQQPYVNFPSPCLRDQLLRDAGTPLTQNTHVCTKHTITNPGMATHVKSKKKLDDMQSHNL